MPWKWKGKPRGNEGVKWWQWLLKTIKIPPTIVIFYKVMMTTEMGNNGTDR